MMRLLLLLALLLGGQAQLPSDSPSIEITSPADFSVLVIKPPALQLHNLFIEFTLHDPPESAQMCVIISAFGTPQNKPEECISAESNHISLSGLNPGNYIFQFIVKKNSEPVEYYFETLEVLRVSIRSIENALPEMDFTTPGDLFFIKKDDVESVDVSLDLSISESMLYDVLDLCVEVLKVSTGDSVGVSDVCTSLSGTPAEGSALSFSLPQMPHGEYQAVLMLRNSMAFPAKRFTASKKIKKFRVVSRTDTLPKLVPPSENIEYSLSQSPHGIEAYVHHAITAKDSSILQAQDVFVCLSLKSEVESTDDSFSNEEFRNGQCVAALERGPLSAGLLGEGQYEYTLALKDGDQVISSSKVTGLIDVRHPEEFVPTFSWQTLHAWHTAPKGLEIRLPVDGIGLKEARVPEPWRLQLSMPHPCKYFLRLDTYKDTSVQHIRKEAAKKCSVADHCLVLEVHDDEEEVVLDDNDTILSSQMYQKKVVLEYNSSCVSEEDNEEEELFEMLY